jgi:hypothetical protein
MLIEAMEKFSRPEWRARPVDRLERGTDTEALFGCKKPYSPAT